MVTILCMYILGLSGYMFFLINYHYKTTQFVQRGSLSKRGLFWLTVFNLTEKKNNYRKVGCI